MPPALMDPSVVVVNPGVPEMAHLAVGLADTGQLRRYVVPFATGAAAHGIARALPPPLRRRLDREFRRRAMPAELAPMAVQAGTIADGLAALAERSSLTRSVTHSLIRTRNRQIQRAGAALLRPGDSALIACYGAAERALQRARDADVRAYLDFPTVHPRFESAIVRAEAAIDPDCARALPWYTVSSEQIRLVERELQLAERVLAMSTFQIQTLVDNGVPEAKIVRVPLGVDLVTFSPPPVRPPGSTFRVIYVGRISQHKGIAYLLAGFAQAAIPDSQLLLVGPIRGDHRWLSGRSGVSYLGARPRYELPSMYAMGDVYVLPSLHEGFPMTALEAMACGVPVVVSTNTFGTDVVEDGVNGYVTPIRDSGAIAERLRYLYEHPGERAAMGKGARRTAEAHSWHLYGRRIAGIIREECA